MVNIFKKKTKIVCTIGPATRDRAVLKKMVEAGMNCARMNFSHGTHADHKKTFQLIRSVSEELNIPIGIIQDLQGPKIRLGVIPEGERMLKKGEEVVFSTEGKLQKGHIPVTYVDFHNDVKNGEKFYLCDGAITVIVTGKKGKTVTAKVINTGVISSHKGVNLPETKVSSPSVTAKDIDDLDFGLGLGVDYIAISFVRSPEDVALVKKKISNKGKAVPVIAKIEKPEAVDCIDEIIDAADGIMVARGDMGIELPIAEVPVIQKNIIAQCNLVGKPVITATQMLESMIQNPYPTRAEVSDVANAVLDGSSAVMLSGETAVGKYPVKVVSMMADVLAEIEESIAYDKIDRKSISEYTFSEADAIAHAAVTVADDMRVKAIVPFTMSGSSAEMIAKYRPKAPIIALTHIPQTLHEMTLLWNVYPFIAQEVETTEEMLEAAQNAVKSIHLAKKKDSIVVVAGIPLKTPGITNLLKLHEIE